MLRDHSRIAARIGTDHALNRARQHNEDQKKMSDGTCHEFDCAQTAKLSPARLSLVRNDSKCGLVRIGVTERVLHVVFRKRFSVDFDVRIDEEV